MSRRGPRPLALHLAAALTTWLGSVAALPSSSAGSPTSKRRGPLDQPVPWRGGARALAAALAADLASVDPEALRGAVKREAFRRLGLLARGIERYRTHPYVRPPQTAPAAWVEGSTRLLDYGGRGRPVMVVPSPIHRSYGLDFDGDRSLLRFLAAAGLRVFVVDWDRPTIAERRFDLTDYVLGRLAPAFDRASAAAGAPPAPVGHGLGGLLALALARHRAAEVPALALLATPWDFHAERAEWAGALGRVAELWLPALVSLGELPITAIQALFFAGYSFAVARKFCAFAGLDPTSPRAAAFVAVEDWLNDGVPLAAPVAAEFLIGWCGANAPLRGAWRVGGVAIRPEDFAVPVFVALPEAGRVAPFGAAAALAARLPRLTSLNTKFGPVGMVAATAARESLWRPLAAWLASH